MKKQDIYEFLKQKNIEHEITEHKAVFQIFQFHIQKQMLKIYLYEMIKKEIII